MRSGVVGLLPSDPPSISAADAQRALELGFTGSSVQLGQPDTYSLDEFRRVGDLLAAEGLTVAQANGQYPSLISLDPAVRQAGIDGMKRHMQAAHALRAETLYIRPGGMNPVGPWYPHPDHHQDAAFERAVESIAAIAEAAQAEGITLTVEGHVLSVLDRPERIAELFRRIPTQALGFNLDPVNFIGSIWDAWNPDPVYARLLEAARGRIPAAHWKDYTLEDRLVLHIEEVPLGQGVIDHAAWLTALNEIAPRAWVLIEHLPPELIPEAKRVLDAAMAEAGLDWDSA